MTADQVIQVLTILVSGGILKQLLDMLVNGFRDSKRAKGGGDCSVYELQAAFWAEACQITREKALSSGMTPEELGPLPKFVPPPKTDGKQ